MDTATVTGNNTAGRTGSSHTGGGALVGQAAAAGTVADTFSQLVREKKEEFIRKLKNGTTEPSYQIGAASYTEKEWKRILRSFDAAQEALRKAAGLENRKKAAKTVREQEEGGLDDLDGSMLFVGQTTCECHKEDCKNKEADASLLFASQTSYVCPADSEEEEVRYITFYTPEGICCRKEKGGQILFEWEIKFKDESQYGKVMDFLDSQDSRDNLWFACKEDFWQKFLNDGIDMGLIMCGTYGL